MKIVSQTWTFFSVQWMVDCNTLTRSNGTTEEIRFYSEHEAREADDICIEFDTSTIDISITVAIEGDD